MDDDGICRYIQGNIDKLCQTEIDEIFKILYKSNCSYTQNNNGVFVNLNWLDSSVLKNIQEYIKFCMQSQCEINHYEKIKNIMSDALVTKDKICDDKSDEDVEKCVSNTVSSKQSRVSSSMKFYLLKKRFQKKCSVSINSNTNNTLTYEEYLIM